jgi:GNAT superfamily N-acetyltransferase
MKMGRKAGTEKEVGMKKDSVIRMCRESEIPALFRIINDAAQVYKGVIPEDRWHEPYMSLQELRQEIEDGVLFLGLEQEGALLGIMGIQDRGEVTLIRHAYVRPGVQRSGVGRKLLRHLEGMTDKPILLGTWADASWAISFYEKNGYTLITGEEKDRLLRKYWTIPERQAETSVVLGDKKWRRARFGRERVEEWE